MRNLIDAISAITDAMAKIDDLKEAAEINRMTIKMQREMLDIYADAIRWIACPKTSAGTYTMDREGCEALASKTIDRVNNVLKQVEL